jgi:hypothetical protein
VDALLNRELGLGENVTIGHHESLRPACFMSGLVQDRADMKKAEGCSVNEAT